MTVRKWVLAVAAGVAALITAGCGSASSTSKQVPTVSLSRAADVSSSAQGYKTALTLHETIPGAGRIDAIANGSFSPASHAGTLNMTMNLPASAGIGTLQLQMVLEKTTIYVKLPPALSSKLPGGKPWVYVNLDQAGKAAGIPGLGSLVSSSSSFSDPGQYLNFLRATSVGSVKNLGQATVNGVRTRHYSAQVDLSKLSSVVPASERRSVQQLVTALQQKGAVTRLPVQAWIDSSNLIRRLQTTFSEPLSTGQSVSISLVETFLQYGPQPAPSVPSRGQTTNLLSLAGALG